MLNLSLGGSDKTVIEMDGGTKLNVRFKELTNSNCDVGHYESGASLQRIYSAAFGGGTLRSSLHLAVSHWCISMLPVKYRVHALR